MKELADKPGKADIQRYKGLGEMDVRTAVGDNYGLSTAERWYRSHWMIATAADEIFHDTDGRQGAAEKKIH